MSDWICPHFGDECDHAAICAGKLQATLADTTRRLGESEFKRGVAVGKNLAIWDSAIEEAGKERLMFLSKKNITEEGIEMDRTRKIRKQMRNEIVEAIKALRDKETSK